MEEIKFVIPIPPVSKKNSMQILHTPQGRPFIAPSKRFGDYQKKAGQYIPESIRLKISQPCNIACQFFRGDRRVVDLTNMLEAIDDVLTHYGVLADDNCKIVAAHDGSRVAYSKENPRTEITITPLDEPSV